MLICETHSQHSPMIQDFICISLENDDDIYHFTANDTVYFV